MVCVVRTPHAVALFVWKKYALTLVVWNKYALTRCIWKAFALTPADRKAHAMVCVVRTPHALTPVVWKKYALTLCIWKAKCPGTRRLEGICRGTRRPKSICRGVRRPDASCLTLIDTKNRRRFDNRRPEGYCGAHLRIVRIRTAGTCWERHVHWQVQSGSICGGMRR